MKSKQLLTSIIALAFIATLVACGSSTTAKKTDSTNQLTEKSDSTSQSKGVTFEILGGEYVRTSTSSTILDGKELLALKVKFTNDSKSTVAFTREDFELIDDKKEIIEPENMSLYHEASTFKSLNFGKVRKGSSKTGYLVYEVKKDEDYTLTLAPLYTSDADIIENKIELKVDPSNYNDQSEKVEEVAKQFVSKTFLNGNVSNSGSQAVSSSGTNKEKDTEFVLGNDINKAKEGYLNAFNKAISGDNLFFGYFTPSDEQKKNFIRQYIAENSKRAQVEYEVVNYLIDSAVVSISPKVINIDSIDIKAMEEDYSKKQLDISINQYIFENLHTHYATASLVEPEFMPVGGYELKMTRNEDTDEWIVDTRISTYEKGYEELVDAFIIDSFYY